VGGSRAVAKDEHRIGMSENEHPVALTVAGSDSGGGAGIQADLKTFEAFGVFGTSAITAVTVQNTLGVSAVQKIEPGIVVGQIEAVCRDLHPRACKTGMLADETLVRTVADALGRTEHGTLVVDPVMVATSGDPLLDPDAVSAMRAELLPLAAIVTPNLDEAAILAGFPVRDEHGMRDAAESIAALGSEWVLIKGGHLAGDAVIDLLYDGREWARWERERIAVGEVHGTGCTLSAAITAGLALGRTVPDAVATGLDYTRRAIEAAPRLGGGNTPLRHSVSPMS